ncbi:MAG: hypothetical protein HZC05_03700 [Candidatus Magasanikbacteria bacterium]|nr:hypothetical protein [Candidatus Magasanikbacteria bacterium]
MMSEIINPNLNPIPSDTEPYLTPDPIRDKKGAAIWKKIQKTNGEITDEINIEFEKKFKISFSKWASKKGLLDGIGMETDQAQEIIDEIEQNQ